MKASVSKSCAEIQERSDHEQNRRRLEDIDQQIQRSLESKAAANQIASADTLELEKGIEEMQRITKERISIEKQLEFKERECQLLSELKEKDEFFQRKIAKKKKKIEKLKTELQSKEFELKSAQQKARLQQDKLLKAQTELREKHEEVKQLQREREKLTHAYNIENFEVSKRIQITVVATSSEEMKVTCWVVAVHYHCIFVYCIDHPVIIVMPTLWARSPYHYPTRPTIHIYSWSSHLISVLIHFLFSNNS